MIKTNKMIKTYKMKFHKNIILIKYYKPLIIIKIVYKEVIIIWIIFNL